MIKKLLAPLTLAGVLFVATPAFAHEVKPGDTMGKIAYANGISVNELANLNPQVKNINLIYVGQNINTDKSSKPTAQTTVTQTESTEHVLANLSEQDLLARLVRAEAESEPYAGKVAVAEVVLNRVDSDQFPNSIASVIYQSGQFSPVSSGVINRSADSESVQAVKQALKSGDISNGALFFYNPRTATSRWLDSRSTTTVIGNHTFKK